MVAVELTIIYGFLVSISPRNNPLKCLTRVLKRPVYESHGLRCACDSSAVVGGGGGIRTRKDVKLT